MAVLHLVTRSPHESQTLVQCLSRAGQDDAVLLLDNAVYAALNTAWMDEPAKTRIYVLQADLQARGLPVNTLVSDILVVDYSGFVELTEQYPQTLSWL